MESGGVVVAEEVVEGLEGTVAFSSDGDQYVVRVYGLDREFADENVSICAV